MDLDDTTVIKVVMMMGVGVGGDCYSSIDRVARSNRLESKKAWGNPSGLLTSST